MTESQELAGQCLCGAVRFHGRPNMARGVAACHCGQCRRWCGGAPFIATRFEGGITLDAAETLAWFRSSDQGERAFCARCGTSLFWRSPGQGDDVMVSLGTLPEDHGLEIGVHVWVEDRPGWYDFADDRPRLTADQWLARIGEADHG